MSDIKLSVLEYVKKHKNQPLVFYLTKLTEAGFRMVEEDLSPGPIDILDDGSVEHLVCLILDKCMSCYSGCRAEPLDSPQITLGKVETGGGRRRSSLDIWRHAKYYFPDISIFPIMRSLHNLAVHGRVLTLFCCDIKRRVFRPPYGSSMSSGHIVGTSTNIMDRMSLDEYGLTLSQWETIGKE